MYEPYALLHYGSRIPYSVLTHSYELLSDLDAMSEDWAFFQADDAFHAAVVQAIGNRFLLQTYEWIQDQNLRFSSGGHVQRTHPHSGGLLKKGLERGRLRHERSSYKFKKCHI